jgi:phage terminase small subunit
MKGLTPKQQAFVEYYAACGNATEAARLAGYAKPHPQGAENLLKPTVKAAVTLLMQKQSNSRIATAQERQQFWTAVLRGIEGYEAEMKDRLKASELLGRCQGDFLDRVESTGIQEIVVRYVQD